MHRGTIAEGAWQTNQEPNPRPRGPGEQPPLRLLLGDDHPVLRAGLRALLTAQSDFDVIAEAECGESALILACDVRPDLILLDVRLPGMTGAEATRRLKQDAPLAKVLALSVHDEAAVVSGLFDAGADGYILKRSACDEPVRAVRLVAAGVSYIDPSLPRANPERITRDSQIRGRKVTALSEREAQVLRLLDARPGDERDRSTVESEHAHSRNLSRASHGKVETN